MKREKYGPAIARLLAVAIQAPIRACRIQGWFQKIKGAGELAA